MKIIPAIDLKDGKCVRLFQGDFEQTTEYSSNPAAIGERFSELDVPAQEPSRITGSSPKLPGSRGSRSNLAAAYERATMSRRGSRMV
jgi:hypothetical protein